MKPYTESEKLAQLIIVIQEATKGIDYNDISQITKAFRNIAINYGNYIESEILSEMARVIMRNESLEQENKALKDRVVDLSDKLI